jgi:hypothetical protein
VGQISLGNIILDHNTTVLDREVSIDLCNDHCTVLVDRNVFPMSVRLSESQKKAHNSRTKSDAVVG